MALAWVGPLYWIQWAGGHRRLHPRGWRTGPGGDARLPDRAHARGATRAAGLYGACSHDAPFFLFGRKSTPWCAVDFRSYHAS
jgi:hypothetical protein